MAQSPRCMDSLSTGTTIGPNGKWVQVTQSPNGMKPKWHEAQAAGIEVSQYAHWFSLPRLGVCLLPRNPFSFSSQAFLVADALKMSAGKFPKKSSQSHPHGWFATGGWDPCPVPLGLTEVHAFPEELPKTVSKKCRFGCLTQTHEAGVSAKRKRFYSGAEIRENSGLPQRPSPLPAQAPHSYRVRERGLFKNIQLSC